VSKKQGWRLRVVAKGRELFGLLIKDIGKEEIFKVTIPETGKHLSLYGTSSGLGHHVTHEKYLPGHGRRHSQKVAISSDRFLLRLLMAFLHAIAPEDDPPPKIRSFHEGEIEKLAEWFERVSPRVFRRASQSPVVTFKGPLGDLFDAMLASPTEDKTFIVDLSPLLEAEEQGRELRKEDFIDMIPEDEMHIRNKRFGFSEDFLRLVLLVEDDTVVDLRPEPLEEISEVVSEMFGVEGYIRSISRNLRKDRMGKFE